MSEELAKKAYETYCEAVGGVAFNGYKLPTWEEFSSNESKQKQANAWLKVGEMIDFECSLYYWNRRDTEETED